MPIKTTVWYHFMPSRMAILKEREKEKIASVGENVKKLEPL